MTDYVRQDDFAARDALATGQANKVIFGADIDTELDAVASASATKEDAANKAQANGYASLGSGSKIPVAQLPAATETAVGVLEIATDAEAVTGTATDKWLTPANLVAHLDAPAAIGGTTPAAGSFDALDVSGTDVVIEDRIIIAANGLTGGGDLSNSVSLSVGAGLGIVVNANDVEVDISAVADMTSGPLGTDGFLIDDGGTMKRMSYNLVALPTNTDSGGHTFVDGDIGEIRFFTGTSSTWTLNADIGQNGCYIIVVNSGSGDLTMADGGSVTLASANGLLDIPAGGMGVLIRESSTTWFLGGSLA